LGKRGIFQRSQQIKTCNGKIELCKNFLSQKRENLIAEGKTYF
jgi:hypothetical protein